MWIVLIAMSVATVSKAQRITNFILYNDDGITQNADKATGFIVIKEGTNQHFIRSDYKMRGPLKKHRTYKDTALKVLDGPYYEYAPDGRISIIGNYKDNKKDGHWVTYQGDSVLTSTDWSNDSLITTEDLHKKDSNVIYHDEKEASYPGGQREWRKYLLKCMKKFEQVNIKTGGKVLVCFIVDTDGSTTGIYLRRSLNYVMDEQSMDAILKSPKWIPAFQNGRKVKAYRLQPFTFAGE